MIAVVLGTRPEIIKLSPVIRELVNKKIKFELIHTNQHYSKNMDSVFMSELNLPKPKFNLNTGGLQRSEMIAKTVEGLANIYRDRKYKLIIVQGDTNSVLGASLAANFEGIPIAHIEAGLRSGDLSMPEEMNRILTDEMSSYLYAPTKLQEKTLKSEKVKGEILVVGNTIVDSVIQNLKLAKSKQLVVSDQESYVLLTLHRPSNVDNKKVFQEIIDTLQYISKEYNLKVIYPIHPRSKANLLKFKIKFDTSFIKIIEPVDYLDMLNLESNAKVILTDSGGLQEEACILKVPCVTIRENTERPETVFVGANIVAGVKKQLIVSAFKKVFNLGRKWKNPFGNGDSSKLIVKSILKYAI